MLTYQYDDYLFDAAMKHFVADMDKDVPDVFITQMRLFCETQSKMSWPRTKSQGQKAVERDLRRAVRPLDAKTLRSFTDPRIRTRLKQLIRSGDFPALEKFINAVTHGRMRLVRFDRALHKSVRDRRGRVKRESGLCTDDLVAWKAYLAEKKGNVGLAPAGWNPFAALVNAPQPDWVARHGTNTGSASGNPRDPICPHIEAANRTDETPDAHSRLNSALRIRAKAMERAIAESIKRRARANGF